MLISSAHIRPWIRFRPDSPFHEQSNLIISWIYHVPVYFLVVGTAQTRLSCHYQRLPFSSSLRYQKNNFFVLWEHKGDGQILIYWICPVGDSVPTKSINKNPFVTISVCKEGGGDTSLFWNFSFGQKIGDFWTRRTKWSPILDRIHKQVINPFPNVLFNLYQTRVRSLPGHVTIWLALRWCWDLNLNSIS